MSWRVACALMVVALAAMAAPALPQVQGAIEQNFSIAGDWQGGSNVEDAYTRAGGAALGDYAGLPINPAGRQKAQSWDASMLSMPEHVAMPHPAAYFMRGGGGPSRITKVVD